MGWNAAIVFNYGVPVPGREAASIANFTEALTFMGKMAADGKCAEPEVFHHPYGGGFMLLKSESVELLDEIMQMDEFHRLVDVASLTTSDFTFERYMTGDALMDGMAEWTGIAAEFAYI